MSRGRRAGRRKDQCEYLRCGRKMVKPDPNNSNTWLGLCEFHTKAAKEKLSKQRDRFYNA